MNENNSNVFKPKAAGPIVAAVALILVIALVVVLVSVIAAASSKDDPKVTTTTTTTTKVEEPGTSSTTTEKKGDEPVTNPGGDDPDKEEPKPSITYVGVDSTNIYKGNLLFIDTGENYYRFDKELLITKAEMAKLSEAKLLETYNFTNVYGKSGGNFSVKSNVGFYLDIETLEAFNKMMAAYVEHSGNKDVQIRNAYYYIEGDLPLNATGKVVDLEVNKKEGTYPLNYSRYNIKADYYDWFIDNCAKFGFVHVEDQTNYSKFRYVGVPHAQYMTENELDLESYLNTVSGYRFENRLVYNDGASEWWIYYVPGSGAETQVPVVGNGYSISGNNIDGFVVAVNASRLANG